MKVDMETQTVREQKQFKNRLTLLSRYVGENTEAQGNRLFCPMSPCWD